MPKIIPVFISYAGCPHQCAFCNQHAINSQKEFSLAAVKEQIDKYLSYFTCEGERELAFYGGSFTGIPIAWQEELLSLADDLMSQGIISRIRLSTRPDYINDEIVQRLKKYKVNLVELGVQSLDDKVLHLAKRGHDSGAVFSAAAMLKNAPLDFGIQLMVGLPGQTWDVIKDTTAKVISLQPATVRIYPLVIFSGTDFASAYEKDELILNDFASVVQQTAYMVEEFSKNKLNVIRIGLQEDEGLHEQGAILGGFHHPAFGELVASYRYRNRIIGLLQECKEKKVDIYVPKRELSQAIGHKRANIDYFKEYYQGREFKFIASDKDFLYLQTGDDK